VNPKFEAVTGYTLEEARGKNPRLLKSGVQPPHVYEELWNSIASGKTWNGELNNRRKNGEEFWESVAISPLRDSEGKVTHYLAVKEDITLQRKIVAELAEARGRAEAAALAKSRFLANTSHELRTPLNSIIGMSELLELDPGGPDAGEYIKTIRASGESLLAIIGDILDLSKIEADRVVISKVPLSLTALMGKVIHLFSKAASQKGLELSYSVDNNLPDLILGDPQRLQQVLSNLVSNALKFTSVGAIRIFVQSSGETDGPQTVRFEVRDSGIGIEQALLGKLFQPFSQLDEGSTRRYGGTGLGLSICHKLAGLMGGSIGVDSVPGEGSSFYFEIPLEFVSASQPVPGANPPPVRIEEGLAVRYPLKILIAEDNPVNQRLLAQILKRLGYNPALVSNGLEAVERVSATAVDLIFMDEQMPEMDGLEATRRIRAACKPSHGPYIVAVTANAYESDREDCLAAGMDDFLPKPVRITDLSDAVERAGKVVSKRCQEPTVED